jgi:serine/threonine-protein kinase
VLAKVLDFGVSKTKDDGPDGPLTAKGTALGTPQYMAPEQLEGTIDIDGRADVWSLAAVLYECLSGCAPFADRGGYLDIMMSIARDRVEPMRERAPWVPAALAAAIDEALERDRDARTPTADAFAERLLAAATRYRARSSATMRRVSISPRARRLK